MHCPQNTKQHITIISTQRKKYAYTGHELQKMQHLMKRKEIEQPRGPAPAKQVKSTPAPTSTPAPAARAQEIEMKDTFEELVSLLTQREQTQNDYKCAMVKALKHITLNNLAKRPDTVFNYVLSVDEHKIGTAYSAATVFIKVMTIPEQNRRQLLAQYVQFYDKHLKNKNRTNTRIIQT